MGYVPSEAGEINLRQTSGSNGPRNHDLDRQMDDKFGTLAQTALDLDTALVRFDKGLHEAEPEAKAALRSALVSAVEAFPDFVHFVIRYAYACVAEVNENLAVRPMGIDFNPATRIGILEGIIKQVGEDLTDPSAINIRFAGVLEMCGKDDFLLFSDITVKINNLT